MNKSKKTVNVKEAKVEATQPLKKVTQEPKKTSVVKKSTKKSPRKKPVAKKLPAKSKVVKKLIDAASPTKVSPRCSSESTSQVTARVLPTDAKIISTTPIVETMYAAYCIFDQDGMQVTEFIGVYNTIHLAKQAIEARVEHHTEHNHPVADSGVHPILVDDISKDKPTLGVYSGVRVEDVDEAIAEERKESNEEIVTANEMEKHVEFLAKEGTAVEDVKELDMYLILGTGCEVGRDDVRRLYAITAGAVTDPDKIIGRIAEANQYYKDLGYIDTHFYSYRITDGIINDDPLQLNIIAKYAMYKKCTSLKEVLIGWLNNSLYMPIK